MNDPDNDLRRRVGELEDQVQRLLRELADERSRSARRQRRERWLRIVFWIAVGGAYAIYLWKISDML